MKRWQAFTLVELLVVMAVILILISLVYPGYTAQMRKVRRVEGQVALLETMQHQERYYAEHNAYLPFSATAATQEAQRFRWWSGSSATKSAYELSAQACSGEPLGRCIELHAVPGTPRVDASFRDAECGTLILNSTGAFRATGSGTRCWP
jgi:type IV pilus assembly protein PilE